MKLPNDDIAQDYMKSGARAEDERRFSTAAEFYEAASLRLMAVGFAPSDPLVRKLAKESQTCRRLS